MHLGGAPRRSKALKLAGLSRDSAIGYDQAELSGLAGLTHYRLGQVAKAEAHLHQALTRLRPDLRRNRVYYTGYLALAQLGQGEVEQACHTATAISVQAAGRARVVLSEFTRKLVGSGVDHRLSGDDQADRSDPLGDPPDPLGGLAAEGMSTKGTVPRPSRRSPCSPNLPVGLRRHSKKFFTGLREIFA